MTRLIGVYGAGGHGREVMPLVRVQYHQTDCKFVFIDDLHAHSLINGHDVLSFDAFCDQPAAEKSVSLAIGNSRVREKLSAKCVEKGIGFVDVRAANTVILDDVVIGEGVILSPFVTLTSNIRIGCQFQANIYSSVSHDCQIGNYVTFAPGVRCNGNVVIEDHAYIGAGSTIRQGTSDAPIVIGAGAVVGMGAVVTKSVAGGATVVGNPARPVVKS